MDKTFKMDMRQSFKHDEVFKYLTFLSILACVALMQSIITEHTVHNFWQSLYTPLYTPSQNGVYTMPSAPGSAPPARGRQSG